MVWATTDADRNEMEQAAAALVGSVFTHAYYLEPATTSRTGPRPHPLFDEAGVGLELVDRRGVVVSAVWCMEAEREGLSFGVGRAEERHGLYALKRFDVTSSAHWSGRLGRPVTHVGLGWHRSDAVAPESIWAVRLQFESTTETLVALGQSGLAGRVEYQPDQTVVVFDERLARDFEVPAQTRSAWR